MSRSRPIGLLWRATAAGVGFALLGLTACSTDPPSTQTLEQICEEAHDVAHVALEADNESKMITNEGISGSGEPRFSCAPSPSYRIRLDGEHVWLNLSIIFHLETDVGIVQDNYCETDGVTNQPTNTEASEPREHAGGPYCFSWGGAGSTIVSSFAEPDRQTTVAVSWVRDEYTDSIYDETDKLGQKVLIADKLVLETIHKALQSAQP